MREAAVFVAGAFLLWLTYFIGYFRGYGKGRLYEITERAIRDMNEMQAKREAVKR